MLNKVNFTFSFLINLLFHDPCSSRHNSSDSILSTLDSPTNLSPEEIFGFGFEKFVDSV